MNSSGLTSPQRLTILLMIVAIIVVFAMLAGFITASLPRLEQEEHLTPTRAPLTAPSPTHSPAPSPTSLTSQDNLGSQVQAARLFDQIAHQVEVQRAISTRAEAPLSFLSGREMASLLRRIYTERDPEAQLRPYIALGLLPSTSIFIRARQTAGIYVPEQKQLYIAAGQQINNSDDQALLAHAHVHVLQDQRFDLGAMDARATTTDSRLAIEALVEGDATLLTAFYRYEDPATADWQHLTDLIVQAEQPHYAGNLNQDQTWARLQRFPYWEGRKFAQALFQSSGWESINQAYTTPPRSTEQVLHPERYLDEQEAPARVVVHDLGQALGNGWRMILQDTLGEFVAGLYLNLALPEETAWQAADGWDGDTFVVWEHGEQESPMRIWRTFWESTAEASEFEHALTAMIPQRYLPARPLNPPAGQSGHWWEISSGAMHVSRAGRYVTLAKAPDINILTNVVEALP